MYKVGDKVIIRTDLVPKQEYDGECIFRSEMLEYCGKEAIITKVFAYNSQTYWYKINLTSWTFTDSMLHPFESNFNYLSLYI